MDIRDVGVLTGEVVRGLNFIRTSASCHFRRHFRQGLRSHIFEVLDAQDVLKESQGEIKSGIRWFPRAVPGGMLRILRQRFSSLDQVFDEVGKYALILKMLGPELIAVSQEFIVQYNAPGGPEILLCGFQEYVHGAVLDPWSLHDDPPLDIFFQTQFPGEISGKNSVNNAFSSIASFVEKTRHMVMDKGFIPDLAGNGNLLLTPQGDLKLVDINNIIPVNCKDTISLDDKNYPSCDKSIEVLALLEQKILNKQNLSKDVLYGLFLREDRLKLVRALEEQFYQKANF